MTNNEKREYPCAACGTIMTKMNYPNKGWLRCPNDSWIEKIEDYDKWVKWYDESHNNPDCEHEELIFKFVLEQNLYEKTDSELIKFGCSCKKCHHHINIKVSKSELSAYLTNLRVGGKQ